MARVLRGVPHWLDPLAALSSDAPRERSWFALSLSVAAVIHLAIALAFARVTPTAIASPQLMPAVIDIEPLAPPRLPPPLPPPLPQEPSEPEPRLLPRATHVVQRAASDPPPPAEPEAGQVIARATGDTGPVDFTSGSAPVYSGGTMRGDIGVTGSPVGAVSGNPQQAGGSAAMASADVSRRAALAGGLDWNCPFPPEADAEGIDYAIATLSIAIDARGRGGSVTTLRDPGHGFGRAAKRCALAKRYQPALNSAGEPVAGTLIVNVRFVR